MAELGTACSLEEIGSKHCDTRSDSHGLTTSSRDKHAGNSGNR